MPNASRPLVIDTSSHLEDIDELTDVESLSKDELEIRHEYVAAQIVALSTQLEEYFEAQRRGDQTFTLRSKIRRAQNQRHHFQNEIGAINRQLKYIVSKERHALWLENHRANEARKRANEQKQLELREKILQEKQQAKTFHETNADLHAERKRFKKQIWEEMLRTERLLRVHVVGDAVPETLPTDIITALHRSGCGVPHEFRTEWNTFQANDLGTEPAYSCEFIDEVLRRFPKGSKGVSVERPDAVLKHLRPQSEP